MPTITTMKKTEQYQCKSYYEGKELLDCTCGKCAKTTKTRVIDFPEMGTQASSDKEWDEIEVPLLRRIQEPKMSFTNKITLVLTVVNVGIFISLIIKNV